MGEKNVFSFTMFDVYRRIVEIVKMNEEFFNEFKAGIPREEVCEIIIANIFQHRQTNDKMSKMVNYIRKNAPTIFAHAENTPAMWNTAVRYTDWCISEIKRYLKNKNISTKSNFELMPDLPREIGKCIYKEGPNPEQIKIIEEYLREDIRNPKRSIIHIQNSKKWKHKEKILKEKPVELENEENDSIISVEVQDESNEELQEYSGSQNFLREDLLRTEFTAEIEDLLQPQGHQTTNKLLEIKSPKESDEILLQIKSVNQSEKSDKTDSSDVEDIKSILESSKYEDDFLILEVSEIIHTSKNEVENSCQSAPSNHTTSTSDININKRKMLSSDEPASPIKKLFMNNEVLNSENTQYTLVNTDENIKNNSCDSIQYVTVSTDNRFTDNVLDSKQIPIPKTNGIEAVQIDENHDSMDINNCKIDKIQNISSNQSKAHNQILHVTEIKVESEIKQENEACNYNTEFESRKTYIEESVKYSDVKKMTYTEILKMMEKILAFCELKNEISLEEFLVLRRTRDKMHWRSLSEKKSTEIE